MTWPATMTSTATIPSFYPGMAPSQVSSAVSTLTQLARQCIMSQSGCAWEYQGFTYPTETSAAYPLMQRVLVPMPWLSNVRWRFVAGGTLSGAYVEIQRRAPNSSATFSSSLSLGTSGTYYQFTVANSGFANRGVVSVQLSAKVSSWPTTQQRLSLQMTGLSRALTSDISYNWWPGHPRTWSRYSNASIASLSPFFAQVAPQMSASRLRELLRRAKMLLSVPVMIWTAAGVGGDATHVITDSKGTADKTINAHADITHWVPFRLNDTTPYADLTVAQVNASGSGGSYTEAWQVGEKIQEVTVASAIPEVVFRLKKPTSLAGAQRVNGVYYWPVRRIIDSEHPMQSLASESAWFGGAEDATF